MERPPSTATAGASVVRVQHQAGDLGMHDRRRQRAIRLHGAAN
jgi:hypothetical protein